LSKLSTIIQGTRYSVVDVCCQLNSTACVSVRTARRWSFANSSANCDVRTTVIHPFLLAIYCQTSH